MSPLIAASILELTVSGRCAYAVTSASTVSLAPIAGEASVAGALLRVHALSVVAALAGAVEERTTIAIVTRVAVTGVYFVGALVTVE